MNKLSIRPVALTALALSIPLTLYAALPNDLQVNYWGSFGSGNYISGGNLRSVAIGYGNYVSHQDSLAIGSYLQTSSASSLVAGKYNANTASAVLLVGTGTGTATTPINLRHNALEIIDNGNVNFPLTRTSSLVTIGNTTHTTSGTTTTRIRGTAEIDRVLPKGGISMGGFNVP